MISIDDIIDYHERMTEEIKLKQKAGAYKENREYRKIILEDLEWHSKEVEWLEELKELRKLKETENEID